MPPVLVMLVEDGPWIDGFVPDQGIGASVSVPLVARNARLPVTWDIVAGTLPPGWTLDPLTGVIAGDADDAGTYSVTVRVTDDEPAEATKTLTWRVQALPLTLTGTLTGMTVGALTAQALTIGGGVPPYELVLAWALPDGVAPTVDGTSLDLDGTLTGLGLGPGTSIPFEVSLTVQDSDSPPSSANFVQEITITVAALTLTGTPDAAGEEEPYTFALSRAGGIGDITITAQSGFPNDIDAVEAQPTVELDGEAAAGTAAGSPYSPSVSIEDSEGNTATWNGSLAVEILQSYSYWNPSDKAAAATLSDSNKVVSNSGTTATRWVRSLTTKAAGKWHVQFVIGTYAATVGVGLAGTASMAGTTFLGNLGHHFGLWGNYGSDLRFYRANFVQSSHTDNYASSSVVDLYVDLDGGKAWLAVDGNLLVGNPSAGTGALMSWSTPATMHLAADPFGVSSSIRLRVDPSEFSGGYGSVSGFTDGWPD
jgi:hypothetical protein